jgi:hypothetical protein
MSIIVEHRQVITIGGITDNTTTTITLEDSATPEQINAALTASRLRNEITVNNANVSE